MTEIHGWTTPGFEGVRDAFVANFERGEEVGAAFSAYHQGQKVVDLWGGVADEEAGTPWVEDTLSLVFSTTKGWTAMAANQLIDSGAVDVSAPAARYWPEFAANGKDAVTVEHLLSHQAGLEWVDAKRSLDEVLAWDPVITALEAQSPRYEPGSSHGYHALTYGWLVGEIIRRVSGQSVGSYVRDHFADPLGLDLWIGLPEAQQGRMSKLISSPIGAMPDFDDPNNPMAKLLAPFLGPEGTLTRALGANLDAFDDPDLWNTRTIHAAEIPAANGICDARSLARLYSACVGEVDGIRLLSPSQLDDALKQRTSGPNTVLMNMDIQFGLGFMLHTSMLPVGGPRSFGHFGAGGSMGWADPEADLAFGYIMNKMAIGLAGDLRSTNLVKACYASL